MLWLNLDRVWRENIKRLERQHDIFDSPEACRSLAGAFLTFLANPNFKRFGEKTEGKK